MYQTITIIGRLGRNPEMRVMPNGENITSLSVACDRKYTKGSERVSETTWFRVSVYGKQAESCNMWLSKGKLVLVEGRLRVDPATGGPVVFADKSGKAGASFEIVANTVKFLSPQEASQEATRGGAPGGDIDF